MHLRCFLGSVTLTASLSPAALSDLMGYPAHSCPAGGSQSHVNLRRMCQVGHVTCRRQVIGMALWWLPHSRAAATQRLRRGRVRLSASPEGSALKLPEMEKVSPQLIVCGILLQVCVEAAVVGKVKAAGPPFVHHGYQRQLHFINIRKHRT